MKLAKTFYFLIFAVFTAFQLSAQNNIVDNVTYDESCDPTNVVVESDGNFTFSAEFCTSMSIPNLGHQFQREVTYVFRDASGTIVKEVSQGYRLMYSGCHDAELNITDLAGLPDGVITMSIRVRYVHTINNPYTNPIKMVANGTQICSDVFTNEDDDMVCEISDVLCFEFLNCQTVSLYQKFGKMRSNVSGGSGSYSYQWWVFPTNGPKFAAGTSDRVDITVCGTYVLIVTDLVTGCVSTAERFACNPIQQDLPLPCLIGVVSNLNAQLTQLGWVLSWNPAAGAGSYIVNITIDDPACCGGVGIPSNTSITTTNTAVLFSGKKGIPSCFSWSVTSVCPNGYVNGPTESQCSWGFAPEDDADTRSTVGEMAFNIYPNPVQNVLNLEAENLEASSSEVSIIDFTGKLVGTQLVESKNGSMNYSWTMADDLQAGIYIVRIVNNGKIINKKFVKAE